MVAQLGYVAKSYIAFFVISKLDLLYLSHVQCMIQVNIFFGMKICDCRPFTLLLRLIENGHWAIMRF